MSTDGIAILLKASQIRFPNQKAKRIIHNKKIEIKELLTDIHMLSGIDLQYERWARLILRDELIGLGLKEISNFLKWIGFSKYLAILDSINLCFLKWSNLVNYSKR